MFENQGGLPRQCEHWLAMTRFFDSLKRAANGRPFSIIRENCDFIRVFNKTLKSVLLGRRIAASGHCR